MNSDVQAAIENYLEAAIESFQVPAWWAQRMTDTGIYRPGLISGYDSGFVLPVGKGRTPMLSFLISWLDRASNSKPWLVLIGGKGVGKTRLAQILGTLWMLKTQTIAKHIAWTAWLNKQRSRIGQSVSGKDVSDLPDIASLYDVPFLIVDDLSTGRVGASTWALETLFALMEARRDRPTIFISNAPLADYVNGDGRRKFSPYRQQLVAQAAKANGDRATYEDLVEKVCDRFSQGLGSQALHVLIKSITGESYRVLV